MVIKRLVEDLHTTILIIVISTDKNGLLEHFMCCKSHYFIQIYNKCAFQNGTLNISIY